MISIDGNTLLPFDSQLYLYDAVGFMIGTASSIDLVAYLEVCDRPTLLHTHNLLSHSYCYRLSHVPQTRYSSEDCTNLIHLKSLSISLCFCISFLL